MTTVAEPAALSAAAPPYSRALRRAAGVCLVLGGLLNGLPQFVMSFLAPDLVFGEAIRWGAEHTAVFRAEQTALMASSLFLLPGLLGVAHVTRFGAPRLTAVALPLVVWGMWGFANVLTMSYVAGSVAPTALSVDQAVALNEGYGADPGAIGMALVPHLVGSFFGLVLLAGAVWRSGAFPKATAVLLVAFLVWDFLLGSLVGVDSGILLVIAWGWMGLHLLRMGDDAWRGLPVQRT